MAISGKSDFNSAVCAGGSFGSFRSCNSSVVKPPWLLSTLADMDKRINVLANRAAGEDNNGGESFAERAESYYQKRPQLLALLQDLYNAYTTLSDRYMQTVAKHQHHHHHHHHRRISSSQISSVDQDCSYDQEEDAGESQIDSDAESSLSYQLPPLLCHENCTIQDSDTLLAEIVIKNVDCDILLHEVSLIERHYRDSGKKIELQKSLLEVLESERLILLNENASLMYKVATLMEENKGLAAECVFMKRKAGEMARCVLKMREDHRVCMLSSKIEDLQGQIYRLEKRNREYYEQLVKKDKLIEEQNYITKNKSKNEKGVALEACFQIRRLKLSKSFITNKKKNGRRKGVGWFERVKNFDMFLCGQNPNST